MEAMEGMEGMDATVDGSTTLGVGGGRTMRLPGATQSRGSSSSGSSGQGSSAGVVLTMAGLTSSSQTLAVTSTPRSLSLASISSEGSTDSHVVEQEDIVALTSAVRNFKEALGRLRKIFHPERDTTATLQVAAHERLGDVLRILRSILERYSPIQHSEVLLAAKHLISHVNDYPYESADADPSEFVEAIDQLALAFSSRVSEYLMGDIDSSSILLNCSTASSRTKVSLQSCENLVSSDAESGAGTTATPIDSTTATTAAATPALGTLPTTGPATVPPSAGVVGLPMPSAPLTPGVSPVGACKEPEVLTPQQMDQILLRHDQGVEHALHRAKVWSKYAKDLMTYIEKRANHDLEYARGLTKLAQTIRPALKEESFLPFQSIYCTALDHDIENCNILTSASTHLQTHKYIEPLSARRSEHERARKAIKETWHREFKRMTEAVGNLKKAKVLYVHRYQELVRARESCGRADTTEALDKLERKREEALHKAREAESTYKVHVAEANERHKALQKVKKDVLQQVRELMIQCDQTMKSVTLAYFQLQHTVSAPAPVQYQTLCESARLYEPGRQYMEFVKRLGPGTPSFDPTSTSSSTTTITSSLAMQPQSPSETPFVFESYSEQTHEGQGGGPLCDVRRNGGALYDLQAAKIIAAEARAEAAGGAGGAGAGGGAEHVSDTDSIGSSRSTKSLDASPSASPLVTTRHQHASSAPMSSGDEVETEPDAADTPLGYSPSRRQCTSKAADTHSFKRLKTPSRCRECDSYVYFHGYECSECGLASHRKCLEALAIQCGHKRLPRKMNTFGVDLAQHLSETNTTVPHLVVKCVSEIDARGTKIKGIYRVSGVKSRVEKLCQAFENGADLVDLTDQHPNVIANVLKLYLRQLPEPLLTFRLYPEFIRISKECPSNGQVENRKAAEELRELVRRLPRHHLHTLAFLMHHLHRVAREADRNNMPSSNLGIVFGPTLLRTSEGSASLSSLVDTVHQTRALELLILCATEIFGPAENFMPKSYQSWPSKMEEDLKNTASRQSSLQAGLGRRREGLADIMHSRRADTIEDVPIRGTPPTRATPTATPPPHHRYGPNRKDSETIDDDWDPWEIDTGSSSEMLTEFSQPQHKGMAVLGARHSSTSSSSSSSAKIYKTSLKDYVGLEGVALHMSQGLQSAHDAVDVVHQKLRKTVSDISSNLKPASVPIQGGVSLDSASPQAPPRRQMAQDESHHQHHLQQPQQQQQQPQKSPHVYKSESKASMSEFEFKMEPRSSTDTETRSGTSGVGSSGSEFGENLDHPRPPARKHSPHHTRAQAVVVPAAAGRTSGTDSSFDSDYSFEVDVKTQQQQHQHHLQQLQQQQQRLHQLQQQQQQQLQQQQQQQQQQQHTAHTTSFVVPICLTTAPSSTIDPAQHITLTTITTNTTSKATTTILNTNITTTSMSSRPQQQQQWQHQQQQHQQQQQHMVPTVITSAPSDTLPASFGSRNASFDNLTSSEDSASSQELDSANATEDSQSSEFAEDADTEVTATPSTLTPGFLTGGTVPDDIGYVSPYLASERGPYMNYGASMVYTRSTLAQFDTKRTITTVLAASEASFDENKVRIQVPSPSTVASATVSAAASVVSTGPKVEAPQAVVPAQGKQGKQPQGQKSLETKVSGKTPLTRPSAASSPKKADSVTSLSRGSESMTGPGGFEGQWTGRTNLSVATTSAVGERASSSEGLTSLASSTSSTDSSSSPGGSFASEASATCQTQQPVATGRDAVAVTDDVTTASSVSEGSSSGSCSSNESSGSNSSSSTSSINAPASASQNRYLFRSSGTSETSASSFSAEETGGAASAAAAALPRDRRSLHPRNPENELERKPSPHREPRFV